MSIGDLWYEASPYIYAPLGIAVLLGSDGALAKVSGCLLLIAAGTILRLRWAYRRRQAAVRARAARKAQAALRGRPKDAPRVRAAS